MNKTDDVGFLNVQALTRRHFFGRLGLGFGTLALEALSANAKAGGKAKAVIYLHMAGSPSQLELFEYKPELKKLTGKDCPDAFLKGKRFAFIRGVPKMLGGIFEFAQHGKSGQWLSEQLPHLATVADELCVIRW